MIFLLLCPAVFALGWVSRLTVLIDRSLLASVLLVFGFTPLIATALSGMDGAPNFHNRDFIGPWVWAFDQVGSLGQASIAACIASYFLGKIIGWIYVNYKS